MLLTTRVNLNFYNRKIREEIYMNKSNTNIIIFSALLLIISVSFLAGLILGFNTGNRSRYQIINANNIVILLDSYTGLTWRNVSSYNNIPNEWQEMKMIVGDANEAKKNECTNRQRSR